MKKHTMTLLGGTRGELRVPADVLLETVGALLEGARKAPARDRAPRGSMRLAASR